MRNKLNMHCKEVYVIYLLFLIISAFSLVGCEKDKIVNDLAYSKLNIYEKQLPIASFVAGDIKTPLIMQQEVFKEVTGWLDEQNIIYITEAGPSSYVYKYNLFQGERTLLYKSEAPIVAVKISPSKDRVLIHSSPTTYLGLLNLVSLDGEIEMTEEVESSELVVEWNPYDENLILISTFSEDWDFNTFSLNIQDKSLREINLPQPFSYWVSKNEVIFQNWDITTLALFAPIQKHNIDTNQVIEWLPQTLHLAVYKDKILVIHVEEENKESAVYTLYNNDWKELKTFQQPHLSRYSDWLVPFNDILSSSEQFLTFRPSQSGELDLYRDGFELVSYDLNGNSEQTLFQGMENLPISCSPNETICLYGAYYDKILDLKTKDIIQLVEE